MTHKQIHDIRQEKWQEQINGEIDRMLAGAIISQEKTVGTLPGSDGVLCISDVSVDVVEDVRPVYEVSIRGRLLTHRVRLSHAGLIALATHACNIAKPWMQGKGRKIEMLKRLESLTRARLDKCR